MLNLTTNSRINVDNQSTEKRIFEMMLSQKVTAPSKHFLSHSDSAIWELQSSRNMFLAPLAYQHTSQRVLIPTPYTARSILRIECWVGHLPTFYGKS